MNERKYTIVTEESQYAHTSYKWAACFNGFDLDIEVGTGETEEEAIIELISLYNLPECNMTKPMENKSDAIKEVIEKVFPGTAKAITERRCPSCGDPIKGFKDILSKKEYGISGLCQDCQDSTWP